MKVTSTHVPGVLILEPTVFSDSRGIFFESYQQAEFAQAVGKVPSFVQDNHSGSIRGVLRGLHYQLAHPQGKLVRVVAGCVFDVAVDVRAGSATFGKFVSVELSASNRKMLWIPPGLAHGFLALGEWNEVLYKATEYYEPKSERSILWSDPAIAIDWPLDGSAPLLSAKDATGALLEQAEVC